MSQSRFQYLGTYNKQMGPQQILLNTAWESVGGQSAAIRAIHLHYTIDVKTSEGGPALQAEDLFSVLRSTNVYDSSGTIWNPTDLSGSDLKHIFRLLYGRDAPQPSGDKDGKIKAGVHQLTITIPFSCPKLIKPDDTAWSVLELANGYMEMNWGDLPDSASYEARCDVQLELVKRHLIIIASLI